MYSREQASQIRQQFWTSFGKYMAPVFSAEGIRVNWINYKTGIRNMYFRMDADKKHASIGIEIMHKEPGHAEKLFAKMLMFKTELHALAGEEWIWEKETVNEHGQLLSRIYTEQMPLNVFKQTDWPAIISFLKQRIMVLDAFWNEHKMIFETID